MTVGQSEQPEAADVSELHREERVSELVKLMFALRSNVTAPLVSNPPFFPLTSLSCLTCYIYLKMNKLAMQLVCWYEPLI